MERKEPQETIWEPLDFNAQKTVEDSDVEPVKFNRHKEEKKETSEPEKKEIVMPWEAEEVAKEEPEVKTSYFSKPSKKKAIDETIAKFNINEEKSIGDTQDINLPPVEDANGPVMVMRRTPVRPERPVREKPVAIEEKVSAEKTWKEKRLPLKGDSKKTLIKKGLVIVLSLTVIICAVAVTIIYGRIPKSEITPKTGVVMTKDEVIRQEREEKEKKAEEAKVSKKDSSRNGNTQNSNFKNSDVNGSTGVRNDSVNSGGQNTVNSNTGNRQTGSGTQPVKQ